MDLKDTVLQALNELVKNGGEGSGDFDHAGRPGLVGGSEPTESRAKRGFKSKSERKEVKKEENKDKLENPEKKEDKKAEIKEEKAKDNKDIEQYITEKSDKGYFATTKGTSTYSNNNKKVVVEEFGENGGKYRAVFYDDNRRKDIKAYSTKSGMEKSVRSHLEDRANKETKALETKTDLNGAETKYKDTLKKYNEAERKKWQSGISDKEYHQAWEDSVKYKKELTSARREYAESIMSNFEEKDDASYREHLEKRQSHFEEQANKYGQEASKLWSSPAYKSWDKASKAQEKAKYYESKAKGVGQAGISADDKNAIAKLAQKYKSGVDSAEKRRIIDRVISIHENNKMAQTSKASESYEKLGFNVERNADANRLQLKFNDIPDASVRSILKSNGFRWSPTNKAWQRQLGSNSEYAFKQVVAKLSDRVQNCLYKHEYIEY